MEYVAFLCTSQGDCGTSVDVQLFLIIFLGLLIPAFLALSCLWLIGHLLPAKYKQLLVLEFGKFVALQSLLFTVLLGVVYIILTSTRMKPDLGIMAIILAPALLVGFQVVTKKMKR